MQMNKLSYSKIGKACGVSGTVVSAILSENKGNIRFSDETRDKVLQFVEDNNFRPNRTWINATKNRHGCIGVLLKNIYVIPEQSKFDAIIKEAKKNGFHVVIDTYEDESNLPIVLKEDVVDGLLIFEDMGDKINQIVKKINIPTVYVNANIAENASINYDYAGSMRLVVDYLKNKKNIAMLSPSQGFYHEVRVNAFNDECKKYNINSKILYIEESDVGENEQEKLEEKLYQFFQENNDVDAVLTHFVRITPMLHRVFDKLNKTIPNDISLISFDNFYLCYCYKPTITALDYQSEESPSTLAIQMLCSMINDENFQPKPISMKYKIVERNST